MKDDTIRRDGVAVLDNLESMISTIRLFIDVLESKGLNEEKNFEKLVTLFEILLEKALDIEVEKNRNASLLKMAKDDLSSVMNERDELEDKVCDLEEENKKLKEENAKLK